MGLGPASTRLIDDCLEHTGSSRVRISSRQFMFLEKAHKEGKSDDAQLSIEA